MLANVLVGPTKSKKVTDVQSVGVPSHSGELRA
jgi:hypothetical protein